MHGCPDEASGATWFGRELPGGSAACKAGLVLKEQIFTEISVWPRNSIVLL